MDTYFVILEFHLQAGFEDAALIVDRSIAMIVNNSFLIFVIVLLLVILIVCLRGIYVIIVFI